MQSAKIVVAGGINVDTTYRVQRLPEKGETIFSTGTSESLGGKGLNQAVAAKRAGAAVSVLGTIGSDEGGTMARDFLIREGVETDLLFESSGSPTGRAMIAVDLDAENMIIVAPGANLASEGGQLKPLDAQWQDIYCCLANGEAPYGIVGQLFSNARQNDTLTVWNPSPMPEDPGVVLDLTDMLVVNESEAAALVANDADPRATIEALSQDGRHREIVLTLGADGCLIWTEGGVLRVPTPSVTAVDPTAAGDTFLGYYLAERAQGAGPDAAAATAAVAASVCVQEKGAADAIPLREVIDAETVSRILSEIDVP